MRDLYNCENFTHITQANLNALSPAQLTEVKRKIRIHSNTKGPACKSDHGQGIAFDLTPPAASKVAQWIDTALSVGLCHHIENDLPHFALKAYLPAGTNCRVLQ